MGDNELILLVEILKKITVFGLITWVLLCMNVVLTIVLIIDTIHRE